MALSVDYSSHGATACRGKTGTHLSNKLTIYDHANDRVVVLCLVQCCREMSNHMHINHLKGTTPATPPLSVHVQKPLYADDLTGLSSLRHRDLVNDDQLVEIAQTASVVVQRFAWDNRKLFLGGDGFVRAEECH
ncbi:hypothetical protein DYB36_003455 [Aphanomyces astaci]|uniref:Uncharacterized protein n=1 Tax=Aphanomyces astaci TaxID=112090 RepID=A0A397ATU2_APHAT|nr:hypothetical protein DYB36_003455 [Aphanomyces astaci]